MAKRVGEETPSGPAAMLPFYLNGTLSAEDREEFEAALAADPELRIELEREREAARLVRDHGGALAPSSDEEAPERLAALMTKIDAEAGPAEAGEGVVLPFRPRAGGRRFEPAAFWRPAFAAAMVVIVIQAGVLIHGMTPNNQYRGMSGSPATSAAPGARLLVRLAPDAKWSEIEALFSAQGLTVVGGPKDSALDVAVPAGDKADDAARRLRASKLVAFVAPES